jgi:Predicted 3'-5' exonuclease related to the exonuclease domain of PolB
MPASGVRQTTPRFVGLSSLSMINRSGFDLPVLRHRAMIHEVFAPGMHNRAYHRYTDDNVDLCDVLSSFSYGAKVKLDELRKERACRLEARIEEGWLDLHESGTFVRFPPGRSARPWAAGHALHQNFDVNKL